VDGAFSRDGRGTECAPPLARLRFPPIVRATFRIFSKDVDGGVKPGHDEGEGSASRP
jgi:hypothetical protein